MSYKLIGKHFCVFFSTGFLFVSRNNLCKKNVKFPSGFLCNSFVKGETKEACLLFLQRFLQTLYLENEEKTSEKKKLAEMFSYQFVAHIPKIRQI